MMARLSQQSSYISALSRQMSGYGYY